jgi:hypothetical protein
MSSSAQRRQHAPSLWPREHGAYVQLLAPLLTSLLFVPPTPAAAGLALSACTLFFAHEPVLVLLGRRGARARSLLEARAARLLFACIAIATLALVLALRASLPQLREVAGVPAACALIAGAVVLARREQRAWGELWVGVTLASFSLPVLVASGVAPRSALELTLGWILVHGLSTLTARGFVHRKRDDGKLLRMACVGALALIAGGGALVALRFIPLAWGLAALPCVGIAGATALAAFRPRTPRALGWSLAAANGLALALFGVGLRSVM